MVTRKKQPRPSDYTMQGKTLADVTHNPYLGIEFQKDLKWDLHINNIVCKANKILGFLRRNLSHCPTNVKAQAYFTLVRPHLEYASCAWDPHLQQDISKLEMVQRQALRFFLRGICENAWHCYLPLSEAWLAYSPTAERISAPLYVL